MQTELILLIGSAASIAFIHTLMGPDHYLPFVAMAKARGWSLQKTLRITLYCGIGHLVGSVALGLVGVFLGSQLATLEWVERVRGETAAWLLIGFGLAYMAWGLRQAWRKRSHSHGHWHGKQWHEHEHQHIQDHAHVHEAVTGNNKQASLAPWIIFIIFVLGPCEPLIPLLMYPAATFSVSGILWVTTVFGLVTVMTMLLAVWLTSVGISQLRFKKLQRFDHAMAGFAIFACGLGITFLGV